MSEENAVEEVVETAVPEYDETAGEQETASYLEKATGQDVADEEKPVETPDLEPEEPSVKAEPEGKAEVEPEISDEKPKVETPEERKEYYRKVQEAKDLKKRTRELEIENLKLKAGSFQELSEEQLDDLKELDPDKYVEYQMKMKDNEALVTEISTKEEQYQAEDAEDHTREQQEVTLMAIADILEVDLNVVPDDLRTLPKEILDYIGGEEFTALKDHLTTEYLDHKIPLTAKRVSDAHFLVNKDRIIAEGRVESAHNLSKKIKKTASQSSVLNDISADGKKVQKKYSDLTPDEVQGLGESGTKEYVKSMENEQ